MAAAVADFRPKVAAEGKLKKDAGPPEIVLEPTADILAGLGARKRPGQMLVGFAAETDDLVANAAAQAAAQAPRPDRGQRRVRPRRRLRARHQRGAILSAGGGVERVPLTDKRAVANAVLDAVVAVRHRLGQARLDQA